MSRAEDNVILRRIRRRAESGLRLGRDTFRVGVAHLPLLRAKEQLYNRDYYTAMDAVHKPMYDRLADTLYALLAPTSVVDVGAGTGLMIARLAQHGVEVVGVEGSRHAIAQSSIHDSMIRANLQRGVPNVGRFDVSICIELAEHLPAQAAPGLVAGLVRLAPIVVFTAATPGQGGTHHVNEQPREYWDRLFAGHGADPDDDLLADLRGALAPIAEPAWMHANLRVFRRRS